MKAAGPEKRKIKVGDTLPIKSCDIVDTYYLVNYEGANYFINGRGKVYAEVSGGIDEEAVPMPAPESLPESIEEEWTPPRDWEVKLFGLAGSDRYEQAVQTISGFLEAVGRELHKYYKSVTPRMEKSFSLSPELIAKYLDKQRGGLATLKAHVIHQFFINTKVEERGMGLIILLTTIISMTENGNILSPGHLPEEEKRKILVDFLNFAGRLGQTKELKRAFALAYRYFIDPELDMAIEKGNTDFYINHSYVKTMKAQRDYLRDVHHSQEAESSFEFIMRISRDFVVAHFLSYLKSLLIMRVHSNSRKEDRGRSELEREQLLRQIIAF